MERLRYGIHVVGNAGERIAKAVRIKVFQRHAIDLFADIGTHSVSHSAGNGIHNKGLTIV